MNRFQKAFVDHLLRINGIRSISRKIFLSSNRAFAEKALTKLNSSNERHLPIKTGPFKDVKYLFPQKFSIPQVAKVLGTYESELHPYLDRLKGRFYQTIINIGCAEGYYAGGFSNLFPQSDLVLFETIEKYWKDIEKTLELNQFKESHRIYGECTVESLRKTITSQTFIFCDCEGCEYKLLDPDILPGLKECDLLLELHAVTDLSTSSFSFFRDRFQQTHDIDFIPVQRFKPFPQDLKSTFSENEFYALSSEGRTRSFGWLFLDRKVGQPH